MNEISSTSARSMLNRARFFSKFDVSQTIYRLGLILLLASSGQRTVTSWFVPNIFSGASLSTVCTAPMTVVQSFDEIIISESIVRNEQSMSPLPTENCMVEHLSEVLYHTVFPWWVSGSRFVRDVMCSRLLLHKIIDEVQSLVRDPEFRYREGTITPREFRCGVLCVWVSGSW